MARQAASERDFQYFVRGLGSVDAVEHFVRRYYAYRDETEEIVRTPQFMLADMGRVDDTGRVVGLEGDCDDVSTFFAACMLVLGYKTRLVAIRYTPQNLNFEHVFCEAYDSGWTILDATVHPGSVIESIEEMVEYV